MKKKYPILEKVEITNLAAEGKSLARVNDLVLFIKNDAVPGDVADIRITKKRKKYHEGIAVKFHQYSDKRVDPFCSHFGTCGGCRWQSLSYTEQLKYKQQQVTDNFVRIGKIDIGEIRPILPSENTRFYRNKLEFTFSNNRWLSREEKQSQQTIDNLNALGFHIPGLFDKVFDVDFCHLQREPSNAIRLAVKDYAIKNNLPFFDIRKHNGLLRNLIVRTSSTGQAMIIMSFYQDQPEIINNLLSFINDEFPEITSIQYVINAKANDSIDDQEIKLFKGTDFILENLGDLAFKISAKSFFQTNTTQALKLYEVVQEYAQLSGTETVYDLYSGTGTIANFLARKALLVIGIENVKEAVNDAYENSKINHITNTVFLDGDIRDLFNSQIFEQHGFPDFVILDPPRAGVHSDVIDNILLALPQKIVYVSCNPATQARDIQLLNGKYTVVSIQPVDMFPHTYHVENVALLMRN